MPYHYETLATIVFLTIYIRRDRHWYAMHYCESLTQAREWINRNPQYEIWKITDIENQLVEISK